MWQVSIHEPNEAVVVVSLDEMGEFVDDEILKALRWFLGEFEIQPNAPGLHAA